ncbi:MAG: hypothetical protein WA177_20390 [Xanthobacteraceae bacterium]
MAAVCGGNRAVFILFSVRSAQNSRSGGVHCETSRIYVMATAERFAIGAVLAVLLAGAPVLAEDTAPPPRSDIARPAHADAVHPAHNPAEYACLNQKDRRAETETGKLIRLSAAIHLVKRRIPGAVVRARLCHGRDGLVYVLTVLPRDGKVAQIAVDAVKGTFAGEH